MAISSAALDPESSKARAARLASVNDFLNRHGFSEVNALRDTSDVHQKIRVQQLYPLDVAEELGDERMMSFLKQLGATKRSKEKASIFSVPRMIVFKLCTFFHALRPFSFGGSKINVGL